MSAELIERLRNGRQADRDGTEVFMSRQACEEAADRIAEQEEELRSLEEERDKILASRHS